MGLINYQFGVLVGILFHSSGRSSSRGPLGSRVGTSASMTSTCGRCRRAASSQRTSRKLQAAACWRPVSSTFRGGEGYMLHGFACSTCTASPAAPAACSTCKFLGHLHGTACSTWVLGPPAAPPRRSSSAGAGAGRSSTAASGHPTRRARSTTGGPCAARPRAWPCAARPRA